MIEGKYLKYSPEINLEIFTLVWDKLESLFPSRIYDWTKDWSFESFRKNGYISIWGNNNTYSFGINNNKGNRNKTEITVQEILGYDPFVKDDFVLPEKWHLKVTNENLHLAKEFCNRKDFNLGNWSSIWKDLNGTVRALDTDNIEKDRIEITLNQFKKYVLKDYIETPKVEGREVIPEYVECIKQVHTNKYPYVGQIIKANKEGYLSGICSYKSQTYNECFKPSTKEAFDAQNQPKQPLKQAVHCTTQEEWDFVTEKLGNDETNWFKHPDWGNNKSFCMSFEGKNQSQTLDFYINAGYQILSFQEWCDLDGYKMKKEVKFEVGDYVILRGSGTGNGVWEDELVTQLLDLNNKNTGGGNINPDFNFKYKNYIFGTKSKYIIRHATPEEINNHLISIEQILVNNTDTKLIEDDFKLDYLPE